MDEHDIEWRCECGHTTPDYFVFCVGCGKYRYYGEEAEAATPVEDVTAAITADGMSPARQVEDTSSKEV